MTVTTEHLNRVTEFAKAQRLSTQEAISTMILLLHARFGYSLEVAHDAILGQGSHAEMVSDLYDELRAA